MMNKPVIYKGKGWTLWYCESPGTYLGYGSSPLDAYISWRVANVGD